MKRLSNSSVRINGETVYIVPNSLVIDYGLGEVNVRAASGGGDSIQSVHGVNAETKVGMINFDLDSTSEYVKRIPEWKQGIGENVIQFVDEGAQGSMASASLSNRVTASLSQDGVISLEWSGNPIQIG